MQRFRVTRSMMIEADDAVDAAIRAERYMREGLIPFDDDDGESAVFGVTDDSGSMRSVNLKALMKDPRGRR